MIRILAYNLSGGLDLGAVGQVLEGIQPDVVCGLEVPGRFALRRLARRTGLEVAVRAGRRRLSVAILTGERARVLSAVDHQLTRIPGILPRSAAQAIVAVGGLRLAAFAVQLGLRPEVRERHCQDLEELFRKVSAPIVLGADLNESPNGSVAARFAATLQDAFAVAGVGLGVTYPNPEPLSRKDYIFIDRSLVVLRAWVPEGVPVGIASHHRPVVAEVAEAEEEEAMRRNMEAAA